MRSRVWRFLVALIVAHGVFGLTVGAQTPGSTGPLTLEGAIERALSANPTIAAARLRGAIATAGLGVAGDRLNPEVRVEFERETPD
jgi:outer membrane protein TolC